MRDDDGRGNREADLKAFSAANPRPMYRVIFDLATAYCAVGRAAELKSHEERQISFAAPAVVNRAFGLELLTKFFIAARHPDANFAELRQLKVDLHGHKLSVLWGRVHSTFQMAIVAKYAMRFGARFSVPDIASFLDELGDDPFVKWRYPYESSSYREINFSLLGRVSDAMELLAKEVCNRLDRGVRENVV